jgi:alpha-ketoglutarate-dependent taurine dioxygenase
MADPTVHPLLPNSRLPLLATRQPGAGSDLVGWVSRHKDLIDAQLLSHGAILFRGFPVTTVEAFQDLAAAISPHGLEYEYQSTPRTTLGRNVFTATEYPASLEIPMHNECAYQLAWPLRLAFCCITPATRQGETPLADMRRVTAAIPATTLERFAARKVRYVRHYTPFADVPWQTVFQTDDRNAVQQFCLQNSLTCEWLDNDSLRTTQVCQGVAHHPVTGECVLFNQAHLFHVSSLGAATAKAMVEAFGDRLPRNATYGDGEPLQQQDLDAVRAAFQRETIQFSWQQGDVLLLDNMQVAHGRRSFSGPRKVLAALFEKYSPSSPATARTMATGQPVQLQSGIPA